jgi:hypothetical protein
MGHEPIATFNFKYRSLEDLQALHIIPRYVPLKDRPDEDLAKKEALQLICLLRKREIAMINLDFGRWS